MNKMLEEITELTNRVVNQLEERKEADTMMDKAKDAYMQETFLLFKEFEGFIITHYPILTITVPASSVPSSSHSAFQFEHPIIGNIVAYGSDVRRTKQNKYLMNLRFSKLYARVDLPIIFEYRTEVTSFAVNVPFSTFQEIYSNPDSNL